MTWRDDYRPASFRGVAFGVNASDLGAGRRSAKHEFPQKELPLIEDLGRKAREYRVTGFVVGSDYFAPRNALIKALEAEGKGTLIHPYHGEQIVTVAGFSVREDSRSGGKATFTVTFIEAGKQDTPTVRASSAASVEASADAVADAAGVEYEDTVVVANVSEYLREDVAAEIESVGWSLAGLDVFSRKSQEVASFSRSVINLIDNASSLATSPVNLVLEIKAAVRAIVDAAENAISALYAYEALFDMTFTDTTLNSGAVTNLTKRIAMGEASKVALVVAWESYDQAVFARDNLLDNIDILSATAPDDLLDSLESLRASIVTGVPSSAEDLPRIGEIELTQTLPSLVVAYNFYDDISAGEDIVSRNKIRHPAFVPGGRSLEVLINA